MNVRELKELLRNYPDECNVTVDTNNINGGSFEDLVFSKDNESPLDHPRMIHFVLTDNYTH